MSQQDFHRFTQSLVGQEVEVITTEGTYSGTLLSVGSDSIVLQTRMNGRLVRLAIRIALIVALFRLISGHRGPVWGQPHENRSKSNKHHDDYHY
ncbi:DUF2642 domain-containing protein [Bacillus sp. REN10]|uniref:DUF2642 domain-containing protein n=1 Tax=Bacillus sp. REN10 TaxID=2782541 RepID=UPI00193BA288|nr:DUF2642 domain-containing protein [Bacillus sp. REN10]